MNNKSLGILLGSALVLAAGAAVVVSRSGGDRAGGAGLVGKDGKPELLLPKAREQMGKIARVKVKRGAIETVLESRESEGKPAWVIASKDGYPADSERVRKLIAELLDAAVVEAKTSKPELYERIGVADVDNPGAAGTLIELADAQGQVISGVIVGNASQSPAGGDPALASPRFFVRRAGEAQSYLASGNLSTTAEPMSWAVRQPFAIEAAKVRAASVTHTAPEGRAPEVVAVSKEKPEDNGYKLAGVPEGRMVKDEWTGSRVAQALVGMTFDDVAPAAGVDMSAPEVVAQAVTFEGLTVTATGVTKDGKKWWAFSASHSEPATPPADEAGKAAVEAAKTTAAEINRKHGAWVYLLPEYKTTQLMVRMEELLRPVEPTSGGPVEPGSGVMAPETRPLPEEPETGEPESAEPAPAEPAPK